MLWFINGSTGSGKTTLLLEKAMKIAGEGDKVKVLSYEESALELDKRMKKLGYCSDISSLTIISAEYPTFPQLLHQILESSKTSQFVMINGYNFNAEEIDVLIYLLEQGMLRGLYITRQIKTEAWIGNEYLEER